MRTLALVAAAFSAALASAAPGAQQPRPQFTWEGEVDGVSVVHIRGDRVDIEDRQGAPVQRDRFRFFAPLPALRQTAELRQLDGRGSVRILRNPDASNNFTLSVLVEDPLAGRGRYAFALWWDQSSRGAASPFARRPETGRAGRSPGPEEEKLTWSGRVDDEVLVECSRNQCRSQPMRGLSVAAERFDFTRPLPDREVRVTLDDLSGRGQISLAEQPAPHNGFTAKVIVSDRPGGADDYAFSLFWTRPARSEPDRLFSRPGFVWRGRVDGTVRVAVRDNVVEAGAVTGGPVQEDRAEFIRPLPRAGVPNLTLKKQRGRGRADVVQYPSAINGWQLVFEVSDTAGGSDVYEVEVGW